MPKFSVKKGNRKGNRRNIDWGDFESFRIYRPGPDSWVEAVNFRMSAASLPSQVEFENGNGSDRPFRWATFLGKKHGSGRECHRDWLHRDSEEVLRIDLYIGLVKNFCRGVFSSSQNLQVGFCGMESHSSCYGKNSVLLKSDFY